MPWNVERMPASEHIRLHNSHSFGEEFDPDEHSQAIREALERLGKDPEWRRHYSHVQRERALRFWNEEAYAEAREAESWTPPGSVRGAARLLGCDRSVFRRSPDVVDQFSGRRRKLNHKVSAIRTLPGDHDVYCLTVPEAGNFALDAGVFVRNCGIIVNVTPLEPTWEGYLTLEISNTTPLPARIYGGEGIAQLLFFEGDEEPTIAYAERQGKYQHQTGVTLPRL